MKRVLVILAVFFCSSINAQADYFTCPGDTLMLNEVSFTEPGQYNVRYTGTQGQDSLVQITLAHYQSYEIWRLAEICRGESYESISGILSDTLIIMNHLTEDGCDSSIFIEIDVIEIVGVDVEGNSHLCIGEETGLQTGFFDNYQWSTGETERSINVNQPGLYSVTVINTYGCIDSSSLLLTQSEIQSAIEIEHIKCKGGLTGELMINPSGNYPPFKTYVDNVEEEETIKGLGANTYNLTIVDDKACSVNEIIEIEEPNDFQEIEITVLPEIYFEGGDITLSLLSTYDLVEWTWDLPDGSQNTDDLTINILAQDEQVSVSTIDVNGCEVSDFLDIIPEKKNGLMVPNIFSPNDDGSNDFLTFHADRFLDEITYVIVYDRWGNQLFKHDKVKHASEVTWDGKSNGQTVSSGSYLIIISYIYDGRKQKIQQIISII